MGTGAKIAIGCGIAVLVAGLVLVVTIGAGVFWAKGKVESVAAEQKQIADLEEQANRNAFTEPDDGVITEAQLVKFIDVRKRVHDVYVKHEPAIKNMKDEKADLGDVRKAFTVMNDIRLAQAKAQAELGMSDAEYAFLVRQVYQSSWASAVARSAEDTRAPEAAEDQQPNESPEAAPSPDVPASNIALFRKYQADIEKYAMNGLDLIGL